MILEYGIKFKASDAHIEPRENKLSVRFRINGLLVEKLSDLPLQLVNPIVARIKILSNLKIDEHRVPQDGRFEVAFGKVKVDIRVSIMPTVYGEKVVLRFLDKTSGVFPLESTGLRGSGYKVYKDALKQTQGIILVTGPTGSGKTVTLASSLAILNKPEVNIVTLEDPVEIRINGVNQVQVNSDVGLTFAVGLRSFLRQDPDIIMVGEIRDEETAQLATQAALVGRLVIATLHTNSAAGAIPRLLNMNIEPFLLSSVIDVIVAQRLPRKICEHCKEAHNATEDQIKLLHTVLDGIKGYDLWNYGSPRDIPADEQNVEDINKIKKERPTNEKVKLYKGKGCEYCNDSGYLGRIGIFEVLKVDEKISKLIMQHKSAQEIQDFAMMEGMITMIQDGFMKALEGITTIEEVLRVQY
jgi:type IV pilus assembly protein PilB